jgi:fimbrial chaperone protein
MWQPSTSRFAFAVAFAAVLAMVAPARAATFSVDPIIVTLGKGNSSASVAITNQSASKLRLQISGFAWQQNPAGEMQLQPTDDLVFFPQLVTLEAGETRRIRIGANTEQGPVEKTFRVFMEELPSLESVVAPKTNAITIRMKVGVPVFVSPNVAPVVSGAVRNVTVRENALAFDVVNTGNTHFAVQKVNVAGKNAAGAGVLSNELTGWYVLPGGTRHFTVPLPKGSCSALQSLAVQVRADTVTFDGSFVDLGKQCGSVSRR